MSKKENIRFILLLTVTTIVIAILILLFCWICYLIPIDFPGTVGEWITAFSALAGGALTLGGVWWTIKNNEMLQKEDKRMEYKPIFDCHIVYDEAFIQTLEDNWCIAIPIEIANIGRGEACDIKVDIKCEDITSEKSIDYVSDIPFQLSLLNMNQKAKQFIYYDLKHFTTENFKQNREFYFLHFQLVINYTDLYRDIRHEYKSKIMMCNFENTGYNLAIGNNIKFCFINYKTNPQIVGFSILVDDKIVDKKNTERKPPYHNQMVDTIFVSSIEHNQS